MSCQPLIEVVDLAKTFRVLQKKTGFLGGLRTLFSTDYREVRAVDGVNFGIAAGELVGYLGPNGAGKSTTIKMLTGILHPSGGQASVLGLVPWRERRRLAYRIAAVFGQRSQLWYHLPPADTFDLLARIYELDRAAYRERVDRLVELFDIGPYLRTAVRKLSRGGRS